MGLLSLAAFVILFAPQTVRGELMKVPKSAIAAFILMNLLLVAACLFALHQNVKLRQETAYYITLLTPMKGTQLPPLAGKAWTGEQQDIVYGQDPRPTLIYTFTKECPHCQQNWSAMRSLQSLEPTHLRIIYIDTQDNLFTFKYLSANRIDKSALFTQISEQTFAYDARVVPQLVLVDRNGRVQWAHAGELDPSALSRVLSLIGHN